MYGPKVLCMSLSQEILIYIKVHFFPCCHKCFMSWLKSIFVVYLPCSHTHRHTHPMHSTSPTRCAFFYKEPTFVRCGNFFHSCGFANSISSCQDCPYHKFPFHMPIFYLLRLISDIRFSVKIFLTSLPWQTEVNMKKFQQMKQIGTPFFGVGRKMEGRFIGKLYLLFLRENTIP